MVVRRRPGGTKPDEEGFLAVAAVTWEEGMEGGREDEGEGGKEGGKEGTTSNVPSM